MKTRIINTAAILGLTLGIAGGQVATTASAEGDQPKVAIIVADLESEILGVADQKIARHLSGILFERLKALNLDYGDTVKLRVASGPGYADRPDTWHRNIELSYQGAKPKDLEPFLHARVAELSGMGKAPEKALMWALDEIGGETDCAKEETHLFVLGDGMHAVEQVGDEIVLRGLPGQPFAGCAGITWVGLASHGSGLTIGTKKAIEEVFSQFGLAMGYGHVDIAN